VKSITRLTPRRFNFNRYRAFDLFVLSLAHIRHCLLPLRSIFKLPPENGCPLLQCVFLWLWSRPLRSLSCILSAAVPSQRCEGLTHILLSHLWHTCNPAGIGPKCRIKEKRWADSFRHLLLDNRDAPPNTPYPLRYLHPRHSQHSVSVFTETLRQNLTSMFSGGFANV
jgi:hypothetical protein